MLPREPCRFYRIKPVKPGARTGPGPPGVKNEETIGAGLRGQPGQTQWAEGSKNVSVHVDIEGSGGRVDPSGADWAVRLLDRTGALRRRTSCTCSDQ